MMATSHLEIFIKLASATLLGGLIGLEREFHGKEAGLRTYSIVCLGSALIMIVSIQVFEMYKDVTGAVDPSRIAAQVVSGIGFLGAGAIIRFPQGVKGLTTAAGVWVAAGNAAAPAGTEARRIAGGDYLFEPFCSGAVRAAGCLAKCMAGGVGLACSGQPAAAARVGTCGAAELHA